MLVHSGPAIADKDMLAPIARLIFLAAQKENAMAVTTAVADTPALTAPSTPPGGTPVAASVGA